VTGDSLLLQSMRLRHTTEPEIFETVETWKAEGPCLARGTAPMPRRSAESAEGRIAHARGARETGIVISDVTTPPPADRGPHEHA
jgi:hypothetical protein